MDIQHELGLEYERLNASEKAWVSARFALYFWPAMLQGFTDASKHKYLTNFLMMNASLLSLAHPHLREKSKQIIAANEYPLMDGVSYADAAAAGAMFARWGGDLVFWSIAFCADDDDPPRLMPESASWRRVFDHEVALIQNGGLRRLIHTLKTAGVMPSLKPDLGGDEQLLLDAQQQLVDFFWQHKMGYFAKQIEDWFAGRFDVLVMTKCLQLPQEIIDSGAMDAQCYLIFDTVPGPDDSFTAQQRAQFLLDTGDELPEPVHHISASQKIVALEQRLEQAEREEKADSSGEVNSLKQELKVAKEAYEGLEKSLATSIDNSIRALQQSQVSVDAQIKSNRWVSWGLEFLSGAFLVAGVCWWWSSVRSTPVCAPLCDDNDVILIYLHHFFPVVFSFIVATLLLRHDAKMLSSLNDLVRQKQTIERFSGLLTASQYARRDIDKSRQLAENTFDAISQALIKNALRDGDSKAAGEADSPTEIAEILALVRQLSAK